VVTSLRRPPPTRNALPMSRIPLLLLCCAISTPGCAPSAGRQTAERPQLAITMDDVPVHGPLPEGETRTGVAERIVAAFREAGVPEVYGFINAAEVEGDADLEGALSAWVAAGYPLGNHTWSHPNLNQVSVEEFEAEIVRNEEALRRFGGEADWRWFRYPYLAEGNDPAKREAIRAVLARRGYRIAAVTMSFADYEWNDAYQRCRARSDAQGLEALEGAYLEAVREAIRRSRNLSRAVYGRDIPYVLLTHVSPFNAHMMPRVLTLYREEGFEFTTLATAQQDSVYRDEVDPSRSAAAPTDLAARARERGLPISRGTDRREMLTAACR
jgi:peptidoglycan-N-acetylglucosamine deacetylase